MNKISLLLILAFISSQILKAQEGDDIPNLVAKKWHIEYVEFDMGKMDFSIERQKINWVIFHPDGVQESMVEGQKYTEKWEYNKTTRSLYTKGLEGVQDQTIISLSKGKLVISVMDNSGSVMIVGLTTNAI